MSENRFATAFLIPGGPWLLVLFVTPLVFILALSFGYTDDLGEAVYSTRLDNYERLVDPDYLPVLFRSVGFALAAVAICLVICYPVAYYIAIIDPFTQGNGLAARRRDGRRAAARGA